VSHRLFHSIVVHEGAKPERWALFLHGILGSGANWRTFAKRVLAERPSWGAVLVDLRMHGNSQNFQPPHTVAACAEDLFALHAVLPARPQAVIGHSFGGKVSLVYAALREQLSVPLDTVVLIDSNPGLRKDATGSAQIRTVLAALASLPPVIVSREFFSAHMKARGLSPAITAWLMMNLRPVDGGFALRVNLQAIDELLTDYFARDDWSLIESPGAARTTVVMGGRSPAFSMAERERVRRAALAHPEHIAIEVIEHAGHWVHVDAPDELHAIVVKALAHTG
jgi:pimeloyl-ACP methyl ester carboxylesterase